MTADGNVTVAAHQTAAAYGGGDSSLEAGPHVEGEGVLQIRITNSMHQLETTQVLRLIGGQDTQ